MTAATSPTEPSTSTPDVVLPSWIQHLPKRVGPIAQGTTLFTVVSGLGTPSEMIWQTLVRIWEANKEQFSGGNMHGLQSGGYLIIPTNLTHEIQTLEQKEAHRIVAEQWEGWQEIRRAIDGRQQLVPVDSQTSHDQQRTVRLTEKPVVVPSSEMAVPVPVIVASSIKKPEGPATVVLPADQVAPGDRVTEMQSMIQGLERLLAQGLPQTQDAGETMAFVRSTELQTALQGLEDRLAHKLQESLRKITVTQQAPQLPERASMQKQTVLEQMFPPGSMLYVLVVENALLLLMASVILWRWFRSRA